MKTVKERLDELFYEYGINDTQEVVLQTKQVRELVSHSFEQGVKFAQMWIAVEDELPEVDKTVLIKSEKGNMYLAFLDEDKTTWRVDNNRYGTISRFNKWRQIAIKENND